MSEAHYDDESYCTEMLKNGKRCTKWKRHGEQYNGKCGTHWKKYPLGESRQDRVNREHEETLRKMQEEHDIKMQKIKDDSKKRKDEHDIEMKKIEDARQKRRQKEEMIQQNQDILTKLNIKSHKDFKIWASKGHPDKGGDLKVFQDVSYEVRKKYPII